MALNHAVPLIEAAPLKEQFVGKTLAQIDPPAAILDLALIRRNCNAMLQSAAAMGVLFRAHVKTHKTIELTRLQVGETGPVRLITSTVAEIEFLLPYLLECKAKGRSLNLIYGMPTPPSTLRRLSTISNSLSTLSASAITLLVDSSAGVAGIAQFARSSGARFDIMVKIDTGYHRSGIPVDGSVMLSILDQISELESPSSNIHFAGFYSHRGDSYSGSTPSDALAYLRSEVEGLRDAAALATTRGWSKKLSLSLGATPTATSIQYILSASTAETTELRALIDRVRQDHDLEVHAGVYPVLDMQQVATHARPDTVPGTHQDTAPLETSHIAIRIMAEVASVYTDRPEPQVLIAAGTLAMGREPCKSYPGWGVVTPWLDPASETYFKAKKIKEANPTVKHVTATTYNESRKTGWILDKISQEHGILGWQGEYAGPEEISTAEGEVEIRTRRMQVGEKIMIWPNHACVAGACFAYYLVVDSEVANGEQIVDVWVRGRGW